MNGAKKTVIFRRLLVYPCADENMEEEKISVQRGFSVNIKRIS